MANGSAVQVIVKGSAWSTPQSDSTPAQLVGNEFEAALRLMQAEAAAFAESVIKDPAAREEYRTRITAARDELIQAVRQGRLTPHEGAQTANAIRNELMQLQRAKLTDLGLSMSKDLKPEGLSLTKLEASKARELYQRAFNELTQAEKNAVWTKIIDSAGKSRPWVDRAARWYGVAGRTLLVASLAFAVYNISTAEDKPRQSAKEGAQLAGGLAGGAIAGAGVVALVSNPAGWVVGAIMFVGAALGGIGSSEVFDYYWPSKK